MDGAPNRLKLGFKIIDWGLTNNLQEAYLLLSEVFGIPGRLTYWDEECDRKCDLLLGPHGYAIYRAMKERLDECTMKKS